MSTANNRICICCGKQFYFCNTCNTSRNTGISMTYDTHECKDLTNALSGYAMKMADKSVVAKIIEQYNITDFSKFKQSIQDQLNELFPKNEVKEIKETQDTNETTNEQNENDIPKEVKPQRKRKSRKKKVVLSDEAEKRDQSDNGDNL